MENKVKMEITLRKCWVLDTAGWKPRWNVAETQVCFTAPDHSTQPVKDDLQHTQVWQNIIFTEPADCELAPEYRKSKIPDEITLQTCATYKKCWARRAAADTYWWPRWNLVGTLYCIDLINHNELPRAKHRATVRWDYIVFEKPNDGRPVSAS